MRIAFGVFACLLFSSEVVFSSEKVDENQKDKIENRNQLKVEKKQTKEKHMKTVIRKWNSSEGCWENWSKEQDKNSVSAQKKGFTKVKVWKCEKSEWETLENN